MKKEDFRFFYTGGQYFCSVRLPFDRHSKVYMNMAQDNRPFEVICADISAAIDLLLATYDGPMYIREVNIASALPELLGYRRATASMQTIGR